MQLQLRKINLGFYLFYIAVFVYQLVFFSLTMTLSKLLTTLALIPIALAPTIIPKIIKYKLTDAMHFVYNFFVSAALVLGSILGWYYKIGWFDLFTHFLSGIVVAIVALIILKENNLLKKEYLMFHIIFILAFSLMIASFWEFFEFTSDKILKGDTQWVKETGVDDTMTDMLIAFLGTILFSIYYGIKTKSQQDKYLRKIEKIL